MLYLRTGANGSCKTLFTLEDVRKMQVAEGREVYYVKDRFKPNAIITEEFGWVGIEFKEWLQLPNNAIILADECHKDLPKRAPSAPVPEHVQMLAEHRARGFDFFLLTQHPMNIDEFVRRLIGAPGYHQHYKRIFGGTKSTRILQWDSVNPECEKDGSGKNAQGSTRSHPEHVYSWYESASLHTAKVRIPKQVFIVAGCVIVVPLMLYYAYDKLRPKEPAKVSQTGDAASSGSFGMGTNSNASERKPMTQAEYIASYQPRIAGLMHTAPAYDKLTEPKRVPVPAACVEMKSVGCKCYTQDATPYPVDLAMCRQLVAQGAFLAFQAEGERKMIEPAPAPRQATETAVAAPPAAILIEGGPKSPGAPTALAAAAPPAQPRVQPGSKWSFQPGGQ
ncbi:zonular occludens toxin domain-containing protein [Variovorax sp. EL159]|uniref:zonular occludens toxin domain-containing protein n=1 Tax=Variovorax sp. EL159 TaxID=1566270 RepID=UPI0008916444|nr:zonular occludens toxin domain-containing protein [Variovorax sp. EL159]SCX69072.1 zona occludens toxin [Variovorax sp. EL159]